MLPGIVFLKSAHSSVLVCLLSIFHQALNAMHYGNVWIVWFYAITVTSLHLIVLGLLMSILLCKLETGAAESPSNIFDMCCPPVKEEEEVSAIEQWVDPLSAEALEAAEKGEPAAGVPVPDNPDVVSRKTSEVTATEISCHMFRCSSF